ncbi:hypothetical protein BDZ94DRAFT_151967 [Collybia nuda]|uniref:Uncharacterized protein n=1 Tax=Collybia nuda TaxID=64659 RepID=A0A9P5XVW8_9AGAR|nr:hypothetical protein BDZ94DRAFT_151967 [Collybia nuda]
MNERTTKASWRIGEKKRETRGPPLLPSSRNYLPQSSPRRSVDLATCTHTPPRAWVQIAIYPGWGHASITSHRRRFCRRLRSMYICPSVSRLFECIQGLCPHCRGTTPPTNQCCAVAIRTIRSSTSNKCNTIPDVFLVAFLSLPSLPIGDLREYRVLLGPSANCATRIDQAPRIFLCICIVLFVYFGLTPRPPGLVQKLTGSQARRWAVNCRDVHVRTYRPISLPCHPAHFSHSVVYLLSPSPPFCECEHSRWY